MTIFSDEPGSIPNIDVLKDFVKNSGIGGPNILYFLSSLPERETRKIVILPNTRIGQYAGQIGQYAGKFEISGFAWQRPNGTTSPVSSGDTIRFNNGFNSLIFTSWWHVYAYRLRQKAKAT